MAALDLFLAHFPRHVRVAAAVERMENFYHSDRLSATTCGYQLTPLWRLGASIIGNRYANDRFQDTREERRQIRQIGNTVGFGRQIGCLEILNPALTSREHADFD